MTPFERAYSLTRGFEGGFANSPSDRGGPTIFGISSKYWPDDFSKVKALVDAGDTEQADALTKDFYKKNFWDAIGGDELDPSAATVLFDTAVNHGLKTAQNLYEQSDGNPQAILDSRRNLIQQIAQNDPTQAPNVEGWNNRLNSLETAMNEPYVKVERLSQTFSPEQMAAIQAAQARSKGFTPEQEAAIKAAQARTTQKPRNFGQQVGRQLGLTGRYAAEGLASIADLPNMAVNAIGAPFGYSAPNPSETVGKYLTELGVPEPESAFERVVGDASRAVSGTGGFIKGAAALSKYAPSLAGLAENAAMQAKAATGSAASSGITRELGGGPLAQLGAGLVGGAAATKLGIPGKELYTAEEIRAQAGRKYAEAAERGGAIRPESASKIIDDLEANLPQDRASIALEGDSPARKAISDLKLLTSNPVTLEEAQSIDKILGKRIEAHILPNGRPNADGRELMEIQRAFRESIEGAGQDALEGGKEGFKAWKDATKLWAQSRRMEDIERILQRADLSEQPANAIRSGFKTLASNPKRMRGFSKEQQDLIRKAAKSGIVDEALRLSSSRLGGIIGLGAASPVYGSALAGLGMASREGGARLQVGKANKILESIAGSKPRDISPTVRAGALGSIYGANATEKRK